MNFGRINTIYIDLFMNFMRFRVSFSTLVHILSHHRAAISSLGSSEVFTCVTGDQTGYLTRRLVEKNDHISKSDFAVV